MSRIRVLHLQLVVIAPLCCDTEDFTRLLYIKGKEVAAERNS